MKKIKISNIKYQIANSKGFTLIELLIVIALLGALAVGLLATVDPFEQLKKGTDTSRRNTTTELWNAAVRYYALKNKFPWGASDVAAKPLSDSDVSGYITAIVSAGELKPDFLELAGEGALSKIYINSTDTSTAILENVAVCYKPESKSFQTDENTQFSSAGVQITDNSCKSQGGTGLCYWCIK